MITIFFWGGGGRGRSFYPSITLNRTLRPSSNAVFKIQTLLVQCNGNVVVSFKYCNALNLF